MKGNIPDSRQKWYLGALKEERLSNLLKPLTLALSHHQHNGTINMLKDLITAALETAIIKYGAHQTRLLALTLAQEMNEQGHYEASWSLLASTSHITRGKGWITISGIASFSPKTELRIHAPIEYSEKSEEELGCALVLSPIALWTKEYLASAIVAVSNLEHQYGKHIMEFSEYRLRLTQSFR